MKRHKKGVGCIENEISRKGKINVQNHGTKGSVFLRLEKKGDGEKNRICARKSTNSSSSFSFRHILKSDIELKRGNPKGKPKSGQMSREIARKSEDI